MIYSLYTTRLPLPWKKLCKKKRRKQLPPLLLVHHNLSIIHIHMPLFHHIQRIDTASLLYIMSHVFFAFLRDRLRVLIPTMTSSSSSSTMVSSTTVSSCASTTTAFFLFLALIDLGIIFLSAIHTSSSTGYRSYSLYN